MASQNPGKLNAQDGARASRQAWDDAALAVERADLEHSHIPLRAPRDPLQVAMLSEHARAAPKARPRGK